MMKTQDDIHFVQSEGQSPCYKAGGHIETDRLSQSGLGRLCLRFTVHEILCLPGSLHFRLRFPGGHPDAPMVPSSLLILSLSWFHTAVTGPKSLLTTVVPLLLNGCLLCHIA